MSDPIDEPAAAPEDTPGGTLAAPSAAPSAPVESDRGEPGPDSGPVAASGGSAASALPLVVGRRQFARTTPVVVDRGRASFGLPSIGDRRQAGQIGLVILMIAALGAILLARSGEPGPAGLAGASPSPIASPGGLGQVTPSPVPLASASPLAAASSPPASPKPSATPKPKTYKVKSGDTLSGIASRFHTTVKAIVAVNALKSPYVIHPGEILKLP
jgi:LysM repeat protein